MAPQESFPFFVISRGLRPISRQQVAYEGQVVRKPLVGEAIHLQIKLRGQLTSHNDLIEVIFQLASRKDADHFPRELPERPLAPLTQVPPGELVMPRPIRKPVHRAAIDLFDVITQPVLLEERSQPLIEARVIRVAVDLAPVKCQGIKNAFHGYQAGDIPVEYPGVFRGTSGSCKEAPPGSTWLSGQAERHPAGAIRQLSQQPIVGGEFLLGPTLASQGLGQEQRYLGALGGLGELIQKFAGPANHAAVFPVGRIGLQPVNMQSGSFFRLGKAAVEERQQLRSARPVEVGHRRPLLRGMVLFRIDRIEDQ